MQSVARKVLFVDDDATLRATAARALTCEGCDVITAESPADAMRLAAEHHPDLAIIDLYFGAERLGVELASALRAQLPDVGLVICSGLLSVRVDELLAFGLHDVALVAKPVRFRALLDTFVRRSAPTRASVNDWPDLAEVQREHVARTLTACDGNVSQTARILGRDRAALQRLLKRLGLDPAPMRSSKPRSR